MKTEASNYHAFLLRLWRENGRSPWRASVENPHDGEKKTFATLEQLWVHVQMLIDEETAVFNPINTKEQESLEDILV